MSHCPHGVDYQPAEGRFECDQCFPPTPDLQSETLDELRSISGSLAFIARSMLILSSPLCPHCKGTGTTIETKCVFCKGRGRVVKGL